MLQEAKILVATKHHKEKVIAPPLEQCLNAKVTVPTGFDTDEYGTFDGTIKRVDQAYETAVKKARDAAQRFGFRYVIASEGSFGPHPMLGLIPGDMEHLVFYDHKLQKVVCEVEVSAMTNFSHLDLHQGEDPSHFLQNVQFGTHALNLRGLSNDALLAKGITDEEDLQQLLQSGFQSYDVIRLETDMRAMHNPTRMHVIALAANKLAKRLSRLCPSCQHYGFGEVSLSGALSCTSCGGESTLYKEREFGCVFCDFTLDAPREDGLQAADPQYCVECNP